MWSRFQYWIIKRWLLSSEIKIVKKENGFTNIQVMHSRYGILVLHPAEELTDQDKEKNFYPFVGYNITDDHP